MNEAIVKDTLRSDTPELRSRVSLPRSVTKIERYIYFTTFTIRTYLPP